MTVTLPDLAHFNDYNPGDFGWEYRVVPRLVPFTYAGVNFGHIAADAHGLFTTLLDRLVPHIEGGLHSGKCWAQANTDDLDGGVWSFHHYGLAVDLNWDVNHMGNDLPDPHGKYAIPRGPATKIAHDLGLEWGGNWRGGFHDLMHFECHLSPSVANDYARYLPSKLAKITRRSPFPYDGSDVFGLLSAGPRVHGGATSREQDYVRLIQIRLAQLGFAGVGWKPAGRWGQATTDAVKRWEKSERLTITGQIDRRRWRLLMAS